MTGKDLKKLGRGDLLEMLLELSKENDRLRKENEQLLTRLEDRNLTIEKSGSLAEAVLQLNGVFEAAQAACEQYTRNIQNRHEHLEEHARQLEQQTQEKCNAALAEAKQQSEAMIAEAQKKRDDMMAQTRQECDSLTAQTKEKCAAVFGKAKEQAQALLEASEKSSKERENAYSWLIDLMENGEAK